MVPSTWGPAFGLLLLAIAGQAGASVHAWNRDAPNAGKSAHRSQTNDLADVLLRAVELMDHGIQDFIKEQPANMPDDAQNLKTSQQKALKVIHQISTNFHDLREVVEKFKHRHQAEVKGVEEKGQKCQTDKIDLVKRSQTCEYILESLAPQGAGNVSVTDWKEFDRKASESVVQLTLENKKLKQSVTDLETRTHEAERRMTDAEAKSKELDREHETLQQQNGQLKADDEAMVKTVKQLVQKNKLQAADLQAKALQQAREEMKSSFAKKEEALKQEIASTQEGVAAAQADAAKYRKQMEQIKQKMLSMQKEKEVLNGDKVHLLGTLNSVLRQNNEYGQQLKMCSFNGTSVLPSLTDPGLSSSEEALVMASKPPPAENTAAAAVAAAADTPMPEVKSAASFAQTSHHALNHWLNSRVSTPPSRKSFLGSGAPSGDGDVLQQLQLLSIGWQNHRVKADSIE